MFSLQGKGDRHIMSINKAEREAWIYEHAAFEEDALNEEEAKEASVDGDHEEE